MPKPNPTEPKSRKVMKRSGVKELVTALRDLGVSADDIVIDRAPDGSVRVYKRAPLQRAQMSDLERWKVEHAQAP